MLFTHFDLHSLYWCSAVWIRPSLLNVLWRLTGDVLERLRELSPPEPLRDQESGVDHVIVCMNSRNNMNYL